MSFLSNFIKKAAPIVATVAPGTFVGTAAAVVSAEQARADASYRRKLAEEQAGKVKNMEYMGTSGRSTFVDPYQSQLVVNQGSPQSSQGFFGTVSSGLRQVGGLVSDAFSSGIPQLFGVGRPAGVGQQPAITTVTNVGAQESSGSGSIQTAGLGGMLPSIVGGARSLLKSPLGQIALGGGAGLALQGIGTSGGGMRITRKMKSQARMVLNMTGGNLSAASQMLGIDENTLVMILLKRFRNDGPVVTKAALRKTKQTVRRLKSMCDMYDSLRPTATRRKAPTRRASTTLISNK